MNRIHLTISGDVQGVGYRAWVKREAMELGLGGTVRNIPEGNVELIAEGPRENLEELVKRCRRWPDIAWVEHLESQWTEGTGEFETFDVY